MNYVIFVNPSAGFFRFPSEYIHIISSGFNCNFIIVIHVTFLSYFGTSKHSTDMLR